MRGMTRKGGVVNRAALRVAVLLAGMVMVTAGCDKKTEELTGDIRLAGSTSMEKMCVAVGGIFMEEEPGIAVSAEYIGPTVGMEILLEETVDVDASSRNLTQEELEREVVGNAVAGDGIAVILSKEVTRIENLTSDGLRDIFCGGAANWNEPGGPNMSVVVAGYEADSGIRDPSEEILGIVDQCRYASELSGFGAVLIKTAATQGVMRYISVALLDDTVQAVSVEGAQPIRENVQNGSYSLNKTMAMATVGAIER